MNARVLKHLLPLLFSLAITSACLFGSAGRLNWWNAWVLLGLNVAASTVSTVLLWSNPELYKERSNVRAGKSWDKAIVPVVVLLGPMAIWITAGLDARFLWSRRMTLPAVAAGVLLAVLSAVLIAWAMRTNKFFSAVVRIQKDRGHTVVTGGPYRFVRHPGYVGIAAFTLATPFILNSRWALLPAVLTASATVLRTYLEDRTLRTELEGYPGYARKVKYRLVPLIW